MMLTHCPLFRDDPDEEIYANSVGDNDLLNYETQVAEMLQAIMGAGETGSLIDFYETMNSHSLNGTIFIVGPGNGGGGTYIK